MKELDIVVLVTDIAKHGLKKGDMGSVVQVYSLHAIEVEFVTASGRTQALLTLSPDTVRPVGPTDIPSVRDPSTA